MDLDQKKTKNKKPLCGPGNTFPTDKRARYSADTERTSFFSFLSIFISHPGKGKKTKQNPAPSIECVQMEYAAMMHITSRSKSCRTTRFEQYYSSVFINSHAGMMLRILPVPPVTVTYHRVTVQRAERKQTPTIYYRIHETCSSQPQLWSKAVRVGTKPVYYITNFSHVFRYLNHANLPGYTNDHFKDQQFAIQMLYRSVMFSTPRRVTVC